jgi:nucleoid DNA-binding protein
MKINLQKEMIKILTDEFGFRLSDAKLAYRALIMALMDNLFKGITVDMRGFGKFYIGIRKPQVIKNRFTQDKPDGKALVEGRKSLRFVPSKAIKDVLNEDGK